jgi:hypothetical protein
MKKVIDEVVSSPPEIWLENSAIVTAQLIQGFRGVH